jgi:hypothetical protein
MEPLKVGTTFLKTFPEGTFEGVVVDFDAESNLYYVRYTDGDEEDLDTGEMYDCLQGVRFEVTRFGINEGRQVHRHCLACHHFDPPPPFFCCLLLPLLAESSSGQQNFKKTSASSSSALNPRESLEPLSTPNPSPLTKKMDKFLKHKGGEKEERNGKGRKGICESITNFLEKDFDGQLGERCKKLLKKLLKIAKLGVDETWFEKAEAEGTSDEFEAYFMDVYVSVKQLLKSCEQNLSIGPSSKKDLSGYTNLKDAAKELKKKWRRLIRILIMKREIVLNV